MTGLRGHADWWHRTLCAGEDRDMWTAESVAERRVAAHRCLKHCPVLDQCAREMGLKQGSTWHTATVAGTVYDHAGNEDKGPVPDCCRTCVTSETYDAYMQANSARALRRRAEVA